MKYGTAADPAQARGRSEGAAQYLASDASRNTTEVSLNVEGGFLS